MADSSSTKNKVKKVRVMQQKGKVFRSDNPEIAVLMWGVHRAVSEISELPEPTFIRAEDFKAYSKITIENHNYNDHLLPSKFKLKEYCPVVFRDLRARLGESSDDYLWSLCDNWPEVMIDGEKKHDSLYITHDGRLVIKTLGREEVESFFQFLALYHAHVVERDGVTLLPHYLGLYRIAVGGDKEKNGYLIVMRNVRSACLRMHRVYDLKGSTVGRSAKEKELQEVNPILKDNDFIEMKQKICLGPEIKSSFLVKLKADAEFLAKLKIMDYSLLVGIHDYGEDMKEEPPEATDCFAVGNPGAHNSLYFIGIIDVLTRYGTKQKAAHAAKELKHGKEVSAQISTVNPQQYCQRFIEFIDSIIE